MYYCPECDQTFKEPVEDFYKDTSTGEPFCDYRCACGQEVFEDYEFWICRSCDRNCELEIFNKDKRPTLCPYGAEANWELN